MSYLNLSELQPLLKGHQPLKGSPELFSRFPFANYIAESWLSHIGKADNGGIPQNWVMNRLIAYTPKYIDRYVLWAAEHNILSWIDVCEELGVEVDTPELSYGLPIRTAVEKGYYAMVERLVQAGANVNGVTGGRKTTLLLAHRRNDDMMVTLLLKLEAVMEQCYWIPPRGQIVQL
jgi:hypothetical protein